MRRWEQALAARAMLDGPRLAAPCSWKALERKGKGSPHMLGRLRKLTLRRLVLVLGVASTVTLLGPSIVIVAMISIVGIPLGLALMVAPTLFLIALGASVGRRYAGRETLGPALAGAGIALMMLAGGAAYFNGRLERTVAELRAGDHDDLRRPLRAKTLALVRRGALGRSKGTSDCDGLCQRLLLSGAVERVLVAALARDGLEWTPSLAARSFRLDDRETCPTVVVADSDYHSAIEEAPIKEAPVVDGKRAVFNLAGRASPAAEMRIAIASGRCLVEDQATLAEADFVAMAATVHRGTNEVGAGLSPWADTVRAERVAVSARSASGFVERYRWTGIEMAKHPPILMPTAVGGSELRMYAGFARQSEHLGDRPFSKDWNLEPDLGLFLRDEVGLELGRAAAADVATDRLAIVTAALDREGALAQVEQRMIEDLFEELSPWKLREADPADAERTARREQTRRVAMRALADPRLPAPRATYQLVQATQDKGDAENAALADVLFARLAATDPALREDHPSYLGWPLSYLANSIAMLPPKAVLAHRDDLERLARDPAARVHGSQALMQLSAFGEDAVPTMLYLVDEATKKKAAAVTEDEKRDRDSWARPFGAALTALCRTASTSPALPAALLARLGDGMPRNNAELLVTIFVKAGADPEPLRPFLDVDRSPEERRNFDRLVSRARSNPECRP